MKYEVEMQQTDDRPRVDIEIFQLLDDQERHSGDGFISAVAVYDFKDREMKHYVMPNIRFGGIYTPDEARSIAEWWKIAATAVETLSFYIKTRDDFDKKWSVTMVGKSLFLDEVVTE